MTVNCINLRRFVQENGVDNIDQLLAFIAQNKDFAVAPGQEILQLMQMDFRQLLDIFDVESLQQPLHPQQQNEVLSLQNKVLQRGIECFTDGDYDGARLHFNEAVTLARSQDDQDCLCAALLYEALSGKDYQYLIGVVDEIMGIKSTLDGNEQLQNFIDHVDGLLTHQFNYNQKMSIDSHQMALDVISNGDYQGALNILSGYCESEKSIFLQQFSNAHEMYINGQYEAAIQYLNQCKQLTRHVNVLTSNGFDYRDVFYLSEMAILIHLCQGNQELAQNEYRAVVDRYQWLTPCSHVLKYFEYLLDVTGNQVSVAIDLFQHDYFGRQLFLLCTHRGYLDKNINHRQYQDIVGDLLLNGTTIQLQQFRKLRQQLC
ncbi:hypothetical protein MP228_009873 [Amoeboaphelidium protococcarum]|nr:hypothetical protein MP228_009873 [Amoeboaphelidium protococcarum]